MKEEKRGQVVEVAHFRKEMTALYKKKSIRFFKKDQNRLWSFLFL